MDLVQTLINAGVIAVVGTLLAAFVNSRTKDLRDELKEDIAEVKQDVRDLRGEMNERFRDQGHEIASLRSDVTQLALAIGSRPQPQAG